MHQVTPELVLRELDRLLSAKSHGVLDPGRIVFPYEKHDANLDVSYLL